MSKKHAAYAELRDRREDDRLARLEIEHEALTEYVQSELKQLTQNHELHPRQRADIARALATAAERLDAVSTQLIGGYGKRVPNAIQMTDLLEELT